MLEEHLCKELRCPPTHLDNRIQNRSVDGAGIRLAIAWKHIRSTTNTSELPAIEEEGSPCYAGVSIPMIRALQACLAPAVREPSTRNVKLVPPAGNVANGADVLGHAALINYLEEYFSTRRTVTAFLKQED